MYPVYSNHDRKSVRVALVLSIAVFCLTRPCHAIEEVEAFSLLAETLTTTENPATQAAILKGMLSGLDGRRNVQAPEGWDELSSRFASSNDQRVQELSMQLSQIFGHRAATDQALALVRNRSADVGRRRTALRSLLNQQNEEASELLESLLIEPGLALDAIRGYSIVQNDMAPDVLLSRYEQFDPELRRAVIETLATRKGYAQQLLRALQKKQIRSEDIPAHVARSLSDLLGPAFVKEYGDIRPIAENHASLIAKYKRILTPNALSSADASRGRVVFRKTCAACHLLYGEGGEVGPDLTGSNRADLNYILLNSVNPSYDVPDAYKMVSILTVDGRIVNGVLAEEDGNRVILKTAEQPRVVIAKADIELRKISSKSMMPDGQLEQLETQEMIDLIKYLRTTEQVEMPK